MSQSDKVIELYWPQLDHFTIITCNKCENSYVIYEAFEKWDNEEVHNYKLIEMSETNYCPYCGSKNRE